MWVSKCLTPFWHPIQVIPLSSKSEGKYKSAGRLGCWLLWCHSIISKVLTLSPKPLQIHEMERVEWATRQLRTEICECYTCSKGAPTMNLLRALYVGEFNNFKGAFRTASFQDLGLLRSRKVIHTHWEYLILLMFLSSITQIYPQLSPLFLDISSTESKAICVPKESANSFTCW